MFDSIFSRYTVLLSAERHNMRGIVHGIFMHVHKKELHGFRTDESAADKKNNNQTNPLRHHGTLKQGIKNIRSQLITFFRSNYFPFFIQTHQEQIYT